MERLVLCDLGISVWPQWNRFFDYSYAHLTHLMKFPQKWVSPLPVPEPDIQFSILVNVTIYPTESVFEWFELESVWGCFPAQSEFISIWNRKKGRNWGVGRIKLMLTTFSMISSHKVLWMFHCLLLVYQIFVNGRLFNVSTVWRLENFVVWVRKIVFHSLEKIGLTWSSSSGKLVSMRKFYHWKKYFTEWQWFSPFFISIAIYLPLSSKGN